MWPPPPGTSHPAPREDLLQGGGPQRPGEGLWTVLELTQEGIQCEETKRPGTTPPGCLCVLVGEEMGQYGVGERAIWAMWVYKFKGQLGVFKGVIYHS